MDAVNYYSKLDEIVLSNKFVEIEVPDDPSLHPVLKTEKSIVYYIHRYVKPHVSKDVYNLLCPSGSLPGAIYGTAKVHKPNTPLRPVISMLNTAQYGLAKYLDSLIKPCIPGHYMLSSSTDFIKRMSNVKLPTNYALVSFDVASLFTNVPLKEVIELACSYVYSDSSMSKPPFQQKHFRKLLSFATSGEFLYKDKLYKQVDGVAMGSPLGPTLANLFLGHLEKNWVQSAGVNAPCLYCRYVDDIFCVFDAARQNPDDFLTFLNEQHDNLTFTCETGPRTLPFLDVKVDVDDGLPVFSVFRKTSYTGLILNFSAFCPLAWKISLIKCLVKRAISICSNWSLFDKEINNIRKIFARNNYPAALVEKIIKSTLTKFVAPNSPAPMEERTSYTLCLPYFGKMSDIFKKRLSRVCSRYQLEARVVFLPFKVSQYFCLKSSVPTVLKSCVVYKYSCANDSQHSYIGKTKRHLLTRIMEHQKVASAVKTHCERCPCFAFSNFKILRTCRTDYEASIVEAILIRNNRPSLNNTLTNSGQTVFLKL